jgi:protein gp37
MRGFDLKPDWIIFGGESGPRRRPVDAAWADAILSECQEFGCAFFMKQMSAFTPTQGKALIPARLLIQEFPGADIPS